MVGVKKMGLKKSIRKLWLTGIQLQTLLAEIEASLKSITLIYLNNYINHQVAIMSAHFPSSSKKNESLEIEEEPEEEYNSNYSNQPND